MRIWDAATGREMGTFSFKTNDRNPRNVAISPDSRTVVRAGSNLQFHRLPEGTLERSIPLNSSLVFRQVLPAFSPDGKVLATINDGIGPGGGLDGIVQLRDATTGEPGARLTHGAQLNAEGTMFSADGKKFVTVGVDGIARVWEVPSGRALHPALQHGGDILAGARFTPDGRHLLVVSTDGVARVWDLTTNRLAIEPVSAGDIGSAEFHPTRPEFITASGDGLARRWRFAPGAAAPKEMASFPDRIGLPQRDPSGAAAAWVFFRDRMAKIDLLTGAEIGPERRHPSEHRLRCFLAMAGNSWSAPKPTISSCGVSTRRGSPATSWAALSRPASCDSVPIRLRWRR
jgi:WD40 repeat protein